MISATEVPTFTATIYVGTQRDEDVREFDRTFGWGDMLDIVGNYCNRVGLCVTVTHTTYFYVGGKEDGFAVGLINYPRFPSMPEAITAHALALVELLLVGPRQRRVSVVLPDRTVMLSAPSTSEKPISPPEHKANK